MSEFFYNLTPDTVLVAAEQSGFEPTGHCMTLNSFENRVFDLKLEDGAHIVMKFYRPGRWEAAQILEEHEFLLELKADEIPVCAPLVLPDGKTLNTIEGIYYAVWPRTGGRAADELSDPELLNLGRLLARIHNKGTAHPSQHRLTLTGAAYGLDSLALLEAQNRLPVHCKERYHNAVHEIVDIYDKLIADVPLFRIHGDCHLGNLLYGSEGWFFLDFDDFLMGPAVQDIWMLAPARDSEGLRQRNVLLEGYNQIRPFDPLWLRLIEPLRALRYIRYSAWIARRWEDPAFPLAFPDFGTVSYWEDKTNDLEEQLQYFYANTKALPVGMAPPPIEDEGELTNKDFFWDWDK